MSNNKILIICIVLILSPFIILFSITMISGAITPETKIVNRPMPTPIKITSEALPDPTIKYQLRDLIPGPGLANYKIEQNQLNVIYDKNNLSKNYDIEDFNNYFSGNKIKKVLVEIPLNLLKYGFNNIDNVFIIIIADKDYSINLTLKEVQNFIGEEITTEIKYKYIYNKEYQNRFFEKFKVRK